MQPDFFHPGNSHALVALQLDSSGHYQILAELFPEIEGQTFNCLLPGLVCCAPSGRGNVPQRFESRLFYMPRTICRVLKRWILPTFGGASSENRSVIQ